MSPRGLTRLLPLLVAIGAPLLCPAAAWAWSSVAKWPTHEAHYRVNPVNQDVTNAAALKAVRFGADEWTRQTRAAFRFIYDGTSTATTQGYNGQNLVLFRDEVGSSPTVHATTYTWMTGSTILETDIVFWDAAMSFITVGTACTNQVYIDQIAIHEFGHALGLGHTSVTTATMYGFSSACSTGYLVLDPDDITGAETLYPCSSASQCNDGRVCTTDTCQNTKCQRNWIPGCCTGVSQCNDSNVCTTDTCQNNTCANTAIPGCCTANSQCGDGNACTTDRCQSNACTHTAIPDCCTTNAQCNDGDPCTTNTCQGNACTSTPIPGCCTADAQCDDGDPCTTNTCQGNACTSTPVPGCCTADAQCDDGDPCTDDLCAANACTHAPVPGCEPPGLDAGLDAGPDAGPDATELDGAVVGGDSGGDAASPPGDDGGRPPHLTGDPRVVGGCACSTGSDAPMPWGLALWVLLVGLWLFRRARRPLRAPRPG